MCKPANNYVLLGATSCGALLAKIRNLDFCQWCWETVGVLKYGSDQPYKVHTDSQNLGAWERKEEVRVTGRRSLSTLAASFWRFQFHPLLFSGSDAKCFHLHYNHKTIRALCGIIISCRLKDWGWEISPPTHLPFSLVMVMLGFVPTCNSDFQFSAVYDVRATCQFAVL